jgi:hypothetical protein
MVKVRQIDARQGLTLYSIFCKRLNEFAYLNEVDPDPGNGLGK